MPSHPLKATATSTPQPLQPIAVESTVVIPLVDDQVEAHGDRLCVDTQQEVLCCIKQQP